MRESISSANNNERQIKPTDVSRRDFLGTLAGGVAGLSLSFAAPDVANAQGLGAWFAERAQRLRFDRWQNFSPKQREEAIDAEVRAATDYIRSSQGRRILEAGSDDEIMRLLQVMPPILREHIQGTKYDLSTSEWPAVMIGGKFDRVKPQLQGLESVVRLKAFEVANDGFGNGFFINNTTLITNFHVLRPAFLALGDAPRDASSSNAFNAAMRLSEKYRENQIDVAAVQFPAQDRAAMKARSLVPLETSLSNAAVHGALIQVVSIKPDERASAEGTKMYPSVALRMTPRLLEFFQSHLTHGFEGINISKLKNLFMYLTPPGESILRRSLSGQSYGHGTSGSPVLSQRRLAGINTAVLSFGHNGLTMDAGFFHGPDEIVKAIREGMVYTPSLY